MAKKVRRVKKRKRKQASSKPPVDMVAEKAAESADNAAKQSISSTDQFRLDYAYVINDLRRVLILAGAMFALLIIINLLLQ